MRRGGPMVLSIFCCGLWVGCNEEDEGGGGRDATSPEMGLSDASQSDLGEQDGGDGGASDAGPDLGPRACDPLVPEVCALPWPSDRYQEPDLAEERRYRFLVFTDATPVNIAGRAIETDRWMLRDGYSPATAVHTLWDAPIPGQPFPTETNIPASLNEGASMRWFRLGPDGLEPIPYWTETNPDPRLLTVWPAAWLEPSTRYVVALRGTPASESVAFDALRRGRTMGTTLADRQPAFDEVFLRLEEEGVPADELELAWTFATASASNLRARLEAMTAEALADPVQYTFTSTTFDVDRGLFSFEGTFTCAHYSVPAELDGAPVQALADPVSPAPVRVGTTEVSFRLAIPESANNQAAGPTAAILQLGLPPFEPLQTPTAQELLNLTTFGPYVVGFAPFRGLTDADEPIWRSAAGNGGLLQFVGEDLLQGVVQQVRFAQVLRAIADSPFVAGNFRVDGSQVHLITEGLGAGPGLAVAGLSNDVGRSVILRPVLDLPFALPRSRDLLALLEGEADSGWDGAYGGPAPAAVVGALARMFLAESGPAAFPEVASDLLVVMAEGDHDASPQDVERWARTVNLPAVAPYAGRAPFGLTLQSPPVNGPGLVLFDFGLPDPPMGPQPPPADSMNPGPGLFEREAVQDLVRRYIREGVIDCAMPPCAFAIPE